MNPQVLKNIPAGANFPYPVLGLGNFDGLHVGHQSILRKVSERAKEMGGSSLALTFEPHPLQVLFPDRPLELLSSSQEKLDLIGKCGIDTIFCLEFTKTFALQSPREFARTFLVDRLKIKEAFVGPNYGFGSGRSGNVETLRQLGEEFGFKVNAVTPVTLNGQMVSSSLIRSLLGEGKVDQVIPFLGRPYLLEGNVREGEGRGKTLGYPTANILPDGKLIPKNGVYAVTVEMREKRHPAIVYIGTQPTFHKTFRQIEAYLFDFTGKLYGEHLKIYFYGWVRGEMTFPDRNALIQQIEKDLLKAKEILRVVPKNGYDQ